MQRMCISCPSPPSSVCFLSSLCPNLSSCVSSHYLFMALFSWRPFCVLTLDRYLMKFSCSTSVCYSWAGFKTEVLWFALIWSSRRHSSLWKPLSLDVSSKLPLQPSICGTPNRNLKLTCWFNLWCAGSSLMFRMSCLHCFNLNYFCSPLTLKTPQLLESFSLKVCPTG